MKDTRTILYLTISEWQLQESFRRDDPAFDAWQYLAEKCGYKHASALRNMCLPKRMNNAAKLGYEDAFIIMNETNDYRLIHHQRERLKEAKRDHKQLFLFAEPIRQLEEMI
jgi:hypothetical protein